MLGSRSHCSNSTKAPGQIGGLFGHRNIKGLRYKPTYYGKSVDTEGENLHGHHYYIWTFPQHTSLCI
jgi:hypothetical protein